MQQSKELVSRVRAKVEGAAGYKGCAVQVKGIFGVVNGPGLLYIHTFLLISDALLCQSAPNLGGCYGKKASRKIYPCILYFPFSIGFTPPPILSFKYVLHHLTLPRLG